MTIRLSNVTRSMYAQCDECFDVVDFEEDVDFEGAKMAIDVDGWKTTKKDGKWINICCDCQ